MPATGHVHVGYLPADAVVGLGAIARLVDCFSKRLSLQEDLAKSVAGALVDVLGARGAGCVVDLSPTCLTARGERRHDARAVTTFWAGTMKDDASLRAEVFGSAGLQTEPEG